MRVRIREEADGYWYVETKKWHKFYWEYEKCFSPYEGFDPNAENKFAYDKAKAYAEKLKTLRIEEIK
jgi:hypothetical protein